MPDAVVRRVRAGGPKIAITDPATDTFKKSPAGEYDRLLCSACDSGILGPIENAALSWARRAAAKNYADQVGKRISLPGDGDTLLRFATGLIWKYSVADERFGRPYAGPLLEDLRATAFGAPPPPSIDLCLVHYLSDGGDFFEKPVRLNIDGVVVIKFIAARFIWFLKVDARPAPRFCAPEALGVGVGLPLDLSLAIYQDGYATWLRNLKTVEFQTLPLLLTAEGRHLLEQARDKSAATRYLGWTE